MQTYTFIPNGVCAKLITFALDNGKIHDLSFVNGCPGNLKAISKLLEGEDAAKAIRVLKGNTCGKNSTSCADQLAIALEKAMHKEATPLEHIS
ncbi:MAG: TIGR03905 family TSCPD domain-containing protein [Desulfovibrio sp.]|nr:TIGR03905 family TSCPD domain-containing protein [Desulfovibrio sp.]